VKIQNKGLIRAVVASLIATVLIPVVATSSQAVRMNGLKFTLSGTTASFDGCVDTCSSDLTIPSTVPGTTIKVTSIQTAALYNVSLRNLILPSTLTRIRENALQDATIQNALVLPSGLTTIDNNAFNGATLTSINFGTSITYFGGGAFRSATITEPPSLHMKAGVIASGAFGGVSFDTVTLDAGVTSVGSNAFTKNFGQSSNPTIQTLSIAGGDIQVGAFSEVVINRISLGSKIGVIQTGAFGGPSFSDPISRGSLTIGSGYIEQGAFSNSNFTSVTIAKGVGFVGTGAFGTGGFDAAPSLGPVSVDAKYLDQAAFSSATMSSLSIGSNVQFVGSGAFGSNRGGPYSVGNLTIKSGYFSQGALSDIQATKTTISKSVKVLPSTFCYSCELGALSIDAQVVGNIAFYQSSATSLTFGPNVKRIEADAFSGFGYPHNLTVDVPVIEPRAFASSSITSLTLGSHVKTIGDSAFSSCADLATVEIKSGEIGAYAFTNTGLTSVSIGSGVTFIGKSAFSQVSSIANVDIANGVKGIGYGAFQGTSALANIELPNSVVSIGEYALAGSGLVTAKFGSGLKYVDDGAFVNNQSLESISFYGAVPAFGSDIFPGRAVQIKHSAVMNSGWTSLLQQQSTWTQSGVTHATAITQPTITVGASRVSVAATAINIVTDYLPTAKGTVQLSITKKGSSRALCSGTSTARTLSGLNVRCSLSKAIRTELKKKNLSLNVTLTYSPDLGDKRVIVKPLSITKR
jgi:hypothetical protein